jgi:hypothetical protein
VRLPVFVVSKPRIQAGFISGAASLGPILGNFLEAAEPTDCQALNDDAADKNDRKKLKQGKT